MALLSFSSFFILHEKILIENDTYPRRNPFKMNLFHHGFVIKVRHT